MLPKNLSNEQIQLIDKYISTHKTSSVPNNSVQPNQAICGWHTTYGWESEGLYQSVTGKHLGIWVTPDIISSTKAYNNYGFNEILVGAGDIESVEAIGFKSDSIMMALPLDYITAYGDISGNHAVGYYFIDEPYEHNFDIGSFWSLASVIYSKYSKAKLILSDYRWTYQKLCSLTSYDGPSISAYLEANNSGIMCDQYYLDDVCGTMVDYWNEYYNYYHSIHSWMNWVDNTMNNAGGWAPCFSWMNAHNLTNIWLYASQTGNESVIQNFCSTAWEYGWLHRKERQIAFVWQCIEPNPCLNCVWGSTDTSMWRVVSWYYTGIEQWF